MPTPKPNESRDDFLDRCIPIVIDEGKDPDQAVAMCIAYFEDYDDKSFNIPESQEVDHWKAFDRKRNRYLSRYTKRFSEAIEKSLKVYADAATLSELREKILHPDHIQEVFNELYEEVGDSFARDTYTSFRNAKGSRIPEIKETPVWIARMQRAAREHGLTKIQSITSTLHADIEKIILRGLEEGKTAQQLADEIVGLGKLKPLNGSVPVRAARIARTEIVAASNLGSLEGARSVGDRFYKIWSPTPDANTRETHRASNIDPIKVLDDEDFRVGGASMAYPGDPRGGAKEVINCRCVLLYESIDDFVEEVATGAPTGSMAKYVFTAATDRELREQVKEKWEALSGHQLGMFLTGSEPVEDTVKKLNVLAGLFDEYNTTIGSAGKNGVDLTFRSGRGKWGYVGYYQGGFHGNQRRLFEMNFGDGTDAYVQRSKRKDWLKGKSRIDEENAMISTVVHEFMHVMSTAYRNQSYPEFWKEMRKLRREYNKEVKNLKAAIQSAPTDAETKRLVDKFNEIYLGEYASTNVDEFAAEGWTEYRLNSTPSPYALRIGALIDKYFKK